MKTSSNLLPEPVQMSVREALRLNAWAVVSVVAAVVARVWLQTPGLGGALRGMVALLPILPGLLYVRSLWRWIRGLDELQRRTQLEAVCGSALGMLLVTLSADLLRGAGFGLGLNFGWEGYFVLTFLFYVVAVLVAHRRVR
ncbi:MAG: hypothetical protein JNL10_13655 [Verrucomicrobiales bacterium]|nr:hypothetical protein [Verrucomicrobiales bacterium]